MWRRIRSSRCGGTAEAKKGERGSSCENGQWGGRRGAGGLVQQQKELPREMRCGWVLVIPNVWMIFDVEWSGRKPQWASVTRWKAGQFHKWVYSAAAGTSAVSHGPMT